MTTLTLDLEQFITAITKAVNKTLPWVWLNPNTITNEDELTRPYFIPAVPESMSGRSYSGFVPVTVVVPGHNKFYVSDGSYSNEVVLTVGNVVESELKLQINNVFTGHTYTRVDADLEYTYPSYRYRIWVTNFTDASQLNIFPHPFADATFYQKLGAYYGSEAIGTYALVDSSEYRFSYKNCRYARFSYLLERNGSYEAGELTVIHDLVMSIPSSNEDPLFPPTITTPFTPPNITTSQNVSIGSLGSLGVIFKFVHDANSDGNDPKFGLAYRIVNPNPAVFPRLTLSYISTFSPEGV